MSRGNRWLRTFKLAAPIALIGVMACYDAPVETPVPSTTQETDVRVEQNIKNKVDILFMVDNSPSMIPKQNQLKSQFPQLIKILDDFGKMNPAWYHSGVVTSDLGAGPYNLGNGQCHPGGDGAQLQAVGAAAASGCTAPTGGVNFIDYNQLTPDASGNATSNLPPGQDLATTFSCMASVGAGGCGFEQQLESVYLALHNPPAANHDFLRPDALLVVVWVTDEDDDCSIPPDSDLFDPTQMQYGALLSYRGTHYGVACSINGMDQLMPYGDSGGTLMGCHGAPNPNGNSKGVPPAGQGKCYDLNRYINFFSKPSGAGGIKTDPSDVILFDITAPDSPVSSILANPSETPPGPYVQCPMIDTTNTCAVVVQHSCIAPDNNAFFGDPAIRIRQVVNSVKNNQSTSICDTSYQSALQSLGALIVSNIGAGCITSPFKDPANPDCVVEDITANMDGSTTVNEIPWCGANHENPTPCWELKSNPKCSAVCAKPGDPAQQFGINIDRGTMMIPANTTARVACSTLAIAKPANNDFMCAP